jgi:hypothetical protein
MVRLAGDSIPAVLAAAMALGMAYVHWPSGPGSTAPQVLLVDLATVAVAGAVGVLLSQGIRAGWRLWIPWLAAGALLAPTFLADSRLAPWFVVVALGLLVSALRRGLPIDRGARRALAVGSGAALGNLAVLCALTAGSSARVAPTDYLSQELRAHDLLGDVPLHDVWRIELQGGGEGRTIRDVGAVLSGGARRPPSPIVIGLVALRGVLGWIFGWDHESPVDPSTSYVERLTPADRERSLDEPGRHRGGSFWTVYTFEREALLEIRNRTVHAFVVMAMAPAGEGYSLYWAIYVKRTSWLTPVYMAMIDPFRRLFVYPEIIRRLEEGWAERWGPGAVTAGNALRSR